MNEFRFYSSGVRLIMNEGVNVWEDANAVAHLLDSRYTFDTSHSSGHLMGREIFATSYRPQAISGRSINWRREWIFSWRRPWLRIRKSAHLMADTIRFGDPVTLSARGLLIRLDGIPLCYADFNELMESWDGAFEVAIHRDGVASVTCD